MKKENLEKLQKLPKWFQDIIEDEVGEYKTMPGIIKELERKNIELERESKKKDKEIEVLSNTNNGLYGVLEKLVKLKVLEFDENAEYYQDEYGNGGGFRQAIWRYKGETIYEDGESL